MTGLYFSFQPSAHAGQKHECPSSLYTSRPSDPSQPLLYRPPSPLAWIFPRSISHPVSGAPAQHSPPRHTSPITLHPGQFSNMHPAGRPRTASTAPGVRLEALTLASKAFPSALAPHLRLPHPAPHTWAHPTGAAACGSGPREDLLVPSLPLHRVRGSCHSLISPL